MKLLGLLLLYFSSVTARGEALSFYDIASPAKRFHMQASPAAVSQLQKGNKKDFISFIEGADSVILRAELALDSKTPKNLRIIFVSPEEMAELTGLNSTNHLGWVPASETSTPSEIYLSIEAGLSSKTLHFLAHELCHILVPNLKPRWLSEGLAEWHAYFITEEKPALAVLEFAHSVEPLSLIEDNIEKMDLRNYGLSFLYIEFLFKKYGLKYLLQIAKNDLGLVLNADLFVEFVRSLPRSLFLQPMKEGLVLPEYSVYFIENQRLGSVSSELKTIQFMYKDVNMTLVINPQDRPVPLSLRSVAK